VPEFYSKIKQIQFIGWQTGINGEPLFRLFNVIGGPYHGSTVSDKTLESWGVEIPEVAGKGVIRSVSICGPEGGPAAKDKLVSAS